MKTNISRRTFTVGTALAAAAVAAPALRAQPRLEKSKISLAVGGKAAFYYLPLTISEQLGYTKEERVRMDCIDPVRLTVFRTEVAQIAGDDQVGVGRDRRC